MQKNLIYRTDHISYGILIFISLVCVMKVSASEIAEGGATVHGNLPVFVWALAESASGPLDAQVRRKIKMGLLGHEKEALAYALENVFVSDDRNINLACIRIMVALENETIQCYKEKINSGLVLDERDKKVLSSWGRDVVSNEALTFVIDSFIDDKNAVPDRPSPYRIGSSLRYCDLAFSIGFNSIAGTREWSSSGNISTPLSIGTRDGRIALFKLWWVANKTNINWSVVGGRLKCTTPGRF